MAKDGYKSDIIEIVDNILNEAINRRASDIHIEPLADGMVVRYRIDGILRVNLRGDLKLRESVIARIKIMAFLDTTGQARPQEGNIKYETDGRGVDLRVSIFPTCIGEAVVIRILESRDNFESYAELGFTPEQIKIIDSAIQKPYGLVLVTGPNSSGKSSTLFNIINKLNSPDRSLVTLEDPVERKMEMVRQTQINNEIGLTFAEGLRYLLRQDPDIIMVGEIRDKETAQIAVEAAITGHLVLATIHTNNAAGAVVRLINMGIEPFLLSSALRFISAQRLARMNCPHCKEKIEPTPELIAVLDAPEGMHFTKSKGCPECNNKGMLGRVGIHEVLLVNKTIANLILTRPSDEQINQLAIKEGMDTLRRVALRRVHEGLISLEEAIRLTE